MYRITVSATLAMSNDPQIKASVRVTVTATAVIINLVVILILDEIYGSVAAWLTELGEFWTKLHFKCFMNICPFLLSIGLSSSYKYLKSKILRNFWILELRVHSAFTANTVVQTVISNVAGISEKYLIVTPIRIAFINNNFWYICRDSKDRDRLWRASDSEGLPSKVYECLCPHFLRSLFQRKVSRHAHPVALSFGCGLDVTVKYKNKIKCNTDKEWWL